MDIDFKKLLRDTKYDIYISKSRKMRKNLNKGINKQIAKNLGLLFKYINKNNDKNKKTILEYHYNNSLIFLSSSNLWKYFALLWKVFKCF